MVNGTHLRTDPTYADLDPFSLFVGAVKFWDETEHQEAQDGEIIKASPDLLPVLPLPDGPRRWDAFHLSRYWIAEAFGFQYQVASTAVAAGLSPGSTIGAVFLGHVLVSIACALNGWTGAVYGINFPVYARASFGVRGTSIAVICRAVAAIIWFGTQTYQGGQCVQVMLGAIWPSFRSFPNHLPPSAHVTSSQLLCFFIFYIIQLPLLWIHISKLRYLFMVKVILMPIFGFTLFGWAIGRAHGFGPVFSQGTHTTTSPAAVLFFSAMTSAIAPKATLALNISASCSFDFTRYAKSPTTVVWTNVLSLSIPVTLCAILGVVVTSAVQVIYGVTTWNPLQVCELWGNRPAQFFAAFCWALSVIATNISANSTAVGNDLTILFPEFVQHSSCCVSCAFSDFSRVIWMIQNSAASFTSFLGGYSIFLGPICGVMLADNFILRHGKLELAQLYWKGAGDYWYTAGFNWRALVSFSLALIPNLPGFAGKVNTGLDIPVSAVYLFSVVWPLGVIVSGGLYLLLSFAFPSRMTVRHGSQRTSTPTDTTDTMDEEKDRSIILRAEGV
ncbi:NCS1 nucleoside transporter family [Dendrothele bispora CBS 962.96]|uniref:NCS1 nucleoside transporter family n=1 Tax=Dendrothele bispora (strain CBS 962.96) TaxID=1314807 RepID=A0A4S8MPH8_DENBC|nr:NCS1 nucleoside transporter family [Dendrothele bispora CBS 962.96]